MSLAVIDRLVSEKVDSLTDEVIRIFLNKMKGEHIKTAHLHSCHCNYCVQLRVYTQAKIRCHRTVKRYEADLFDDNSALFLVSQAQREATNQRALKNAAKELDLPQGRHTEHY